MHTYICTNKQNNIPTLSWGTAMVIVTISGLSEETAGLRVMVAVAVALAMVLVVLMMITSGYELFVIAVKRLCGESNFASGT